MPDRPAIAIMPVHGMPLIRPGDDLAGAIAYALRAGGPALADGDIVVVAQKVVSKAEGRYVDLATLLPSVEAQQLAAATGKHPQHVQAVLNESTRVVRQGRHVLIVEHRSGLVMANAGIDQSNIDRTEGQDPALLLPTDPDMSAATLRDSLSAAFGTSIAVIVSDSFGRPFRLGSVGVAIGAAGLPALMDMRGETDLSGRALRVTEIAFADQVASAAGLAMGEAAEAVPVAIVRGLRWSAPDRPAASMIRPAEEDLFR